MRKHSLWRYETLRDLLDARAGAYRGTSYGPATIVIERWENGFYSALCKNLRPRRAAKRLEAYFPYEEVERAKQVLARTASASIRLGVRKVGRGIWQHKADSGRGDFCVVSAVVQRRHLSLHFQSVELSTGLIYDSVIIDELARVLGVRWATVTIFAANVAVLARRGSENESHYYKIREALDAATA